MLLYRNLNPPHDSGGRESLAKIYGKGELATILHRFNRFCIRLPISEQVTWTDSSIGKQHKIEKVHVVNFLSCVSSRGNNARNTERNRNCSKENSKKNPRRTHRKKENPWPGQQIKSYVRNRCLKNHCDRYDGCERGNLSSLRKGL